LSTQRTLNVLSKKIKIYFIPGNRDFLVGKYFQEKNHIHFLKDNTLIKLGKLNTLLLHGDTLCTDDYRYQIFRFFSRKKFLINLFLSCRSVEKRKLFCETLRKKSSSKQSNNPDNIIDVNENAVKKLFINNNYVPLMIHGHTHRLKTHDYNFDGHQCQRWVLGDWDNQANYLVWDGKKLQNKFFNLN